MNPILFRQAWTIWLITSLFSLFQFFLQVASNMMTTQFMQTFHIDAAGVGLLSSAFFYSYVLVQIPAGLLFDQFQLRRVLLVAVSLCGLGCALFSVSPNFETAFFSRLLMGAGGGFAFVGMVFACAESFPPAMFAMVVGLGELVGMLGTSIGQKLVPHLVIQQGWRAVMLGCAAIACALLITLFFALKDQPKAHQSELSLWKNIRYNITQVARIPTVWLAGLFCCGMFAVVTTFASLWGVPFLQAVHHLSYLQATSHIASILLGIALGGPLAGWLYGKIASPKFLMLGFGLASLCCTLIVMFYINLPPLALYICLIGMGLFCSIYVTSFSVVSSVTPAAIRGTALGLCNAIALLGAIVFQPLSGLLFTTLEHSSSNLIENYQLSLLVLPGIMLVGLLSIALVKAKR
ncbi:MAG: MFS transporter [Gammaproteobacteria bacterium]|nr:MFS transporter [Gammaproteobacteria bacterium]